MSDRRRDPAGRSDVGMWFSVILLWIAVLPSPLFGQQSFRPGLNGPGRPAVRANASMAGSAGWGRGVSGSAGWHTGSTASQSVSGSQLSSGSQLGAVGNGFGWSPSYGYSGHLISGGYPAWGLGSAFPVGGGFCGNVYPWSIPPVYVRNTDGGVFIVPTYGNYGYGAGLNYGYPGFYSGYGLISGGWPGCGIVPSYLSWQLSYADLAFNPWITSSASWTVVPSPARFGSAFSAASSAVSADVLLTPDRGWQVRDVPPPPVPAPGFPGAEENVMLDDEFPVIARKAETSSAVARLQSLRNQTQGDLAFRSGEYVTAEVYYLRAIEEAPDRRAPWLRAAFAKIALADFGEAASCLKTGLLLLPDKTHAWVRASEIYGSELGQDVETHADKLWDWLSQNPLSADRLLLVGTFYQFQGNRAAADELLEMLGRRDDRFVLVSALRSIIADDQSMRAELSSAIRAVSADSSVGAVPESRPFSELLPAEAAGAEHDEVPLRQQTEPAEGIFMKGRRAVSRDQHKSSGGRWPENPDQIAPEDGGSRVPAIPAPLTIPPIAKP